MHRIEAGLLIPGHGGPVSDGMIVLDGLLLRALGPLLGGARRARRAA
jgi:hypothetical protein